jgi:hypothetical protein
MAHGRNKYQSRESRTRIREIMMRDWDPIGVAGVPEAVDEYARYVAQVYLMLMEQRTSVEVITSYLFDIATKNMGLSNSAELAECSRRTALALVAARTDFETH